MVRDEDDRRAAMAEQRKEEKDKMKEIFGDNLVSKPKQGRLEDKE